MRIAVISDAVYPTPYEAGHGLGRSAYNMALGLVERGHEVILFGCHGSRLPGGDVITVQQVNDGRQERALFRAVFDNIYKYDIAVDMSHTHRMGARQIVPTITCFQDRAGYHGKNMVFPSQYVANYVNQPGKVIYNGIRLEDYPLYEGDRDDCLLFIGSDIEHKGVKIARKVSEISGLPLFEYGSGCRNGTISGTEKVRWYQHARAVLCPYKIDAGPHVPLEAMACGTPVVALDLAAMPEYVPAGGGFLVADPEEMAIVLESIDVFEPGSVRKVVEPFNIDIRVSKYESLLRGLQEGKVW